MSTGIDEMFTCMLNNVVPGNWAKVGFLSLKPLSAWMEEFILRVEFFANWLELALKKE